MRLDIADFDPPFHWSVNPQAEAAHRRSITWLRCFGVITDEESATRHLAERWGLWGGVAWPMGDAEGLQLGVDLPSLWTVLDTRLSGDRNHDELLDSLRHAIVRPGDPGPIPVARALADLWSRQRRRACAVSQALLERSEHHWLEWIDACAAEADSQRRADLRTCSLSDYDALRDVTGVMQVIYTFDEAIGGYEVPSPARHLAPGTPLGAMRQAATRYIDYLNDLTSLPKEEADGETLNGVLVLQQQDRCSREAAIAEVRRMLRSHLDRFLAEESTLPDYCAAHGLDLGDRRAVYRTVAGMRNIISAVYMISVHSGRWALTPENGQAGSAL
ncbi:terpene synthase family protein [Nonomuraea typhae]|uniref:terpene synthase family protein n=1 Tax=Nonomuraea typhae TaxID=2603600 RepID=UPI001CA4B662|nr:hypothetical protein [Nonomuraea typhae]